jgi:hypothetical protein
MINLLDAFSIYYATKFFKKRKVKDIEKELEIAFLGLPKKTRDLLAQKIYGQLNKQEKFKK